jgi:arsenical pump membrane protein
VLVVLAVALVAFAVSSPLGVDPAWVAAGAAIALAVPALARRRSNALDVARATSVPFLTFVVGLAVVVEAVRVNGLGSAMASLVPGGDSLLVLLAIAALAAVLANLVNNLPAILILLPIVATGGTGPVLAALIGVNIGPNLTYVGSLATLLWRRSLSRHDVDPDPGEFVRLGLAVVPAALVASTAALWLSLQVLG